MINYKIAFKELPWQSLFRGIRYKQYSNNGKVVRLIEISQELKHLEWCTKGHIGYVITGQLEIKFEKTIFVYHAGDGLFIPPGEEHKHIPKAISETVTLIVIEDE